MAAVVDGVSTVGGRRDSDASSLLATLPGGGSTAAGPTGPPITFLYKMCAGACPKSYGMQVPPLITQCWAEPQ